MSRKKAAAYIAAISLIILSGLLLPYAIRWTSDFLSGQISRHFGKGGKDPESLFYSTERTSETEPERGNAEISKEETEMTGNPEKHGNEEADSTGSNAAPFTYEDLMAYHSENRPKVSGEKEYLDTFLWDREESFKNAVLNYLFAYYRDYYRVEEIRLLNLEEGAGGILKSEIELSLSQGTNRGYTKLFCTYDRNEDVYTISQDSDDGMK